MTPGVRRLLTPSSIAQHVLVLLVVVGLTRLGVWQLSRLSEVRDRNDAQATRFEQPAEPVEDLLADLSLSDVDVLAGLEFRPVTATGTYRTTDEVLQRGRSLNGRSGYHVLTPLDLADGTTVMVRRGWVPFDVDLLPPVPDAIPPDGTVTVTGYVERSIPQPTGLVAQRDPEQGELDVVFHADLDRLGPQLGGEVLPMLVHLEDQAPAQAGELPVPAARPEQDEGTHLSYAFQWFAFALTAVGFYAVHLWRRVHRVEDEDAPHDETPAPVDA